MAESALRDVIVFLDEVGVYDVVLPFLLVFTVSFAILEKTKILGTEEIEGKRYAKKNLNAMVAFVMGFLVVASTQLVAIVNETVSHAALILILLVLFLLLVGSFYKEGEDVFLGGAWRTVFMIIIGIAMLLIFLNAVGWLGTLGDWFADSYQEPWFGAIVLIIFVIIVMVLITRDSRPRVVKKEHSDPK